MENRLDPNLERFDTYEHACQQFNWVIPKRFNIASEICRKHPDAVTRIALSDIKQGGINTFTFGGLDFLSDKFATALSNSGIRQGDSVAVALGSSAALLIAHLGALKAGAVVVPLSLIHDAPSLEPALRGSDARALVVHETDRTRVEGLAQKLPSLKSLFVVCDLRPVIASPAVRDFWEEIDRGSSQFESVETDASAAAFIFYIDQQGKSTGVVHSHRSVIAQLAAFEMVVDVASDSACGPVGNWSSPYTLLGLIFPSLWHGSTVARDAPEDDAVAQRVRVNDAYGKPETGWIIAKCDRWFTTAAGSIGKRVPGRSINIVDKTGSIVAPRQVGHLAVHKSDPGLFTEYHRAPDKTNASFVGDWFLTGDMGYQNRDGDFFLK